MPTIITSGAASARGFGHMTKVYGVNFQYSNFASTTDLSLVSTSSITSNYIYITSAATTGDVGNVYRSSTLKYNRNFSFEWVFECSGGTTFNGYTGDGFVLQWTKTNNTNGNSGGSLSRIASSDTIHALGFATYSYNNMTWWKNNVSQELQSQALDWRQNLYYWADYDHAAQTMKIYYATSSTKSSVRHTFNNFLFDAGDYYIGFGAATGAATDNHILKSMKLTLL